MFIRQIDFSDYDNSDQIFFYLALGEQKMKCGALYKLGLIFISLSFIEANAGWFSPADQRECIEKYQSKVRLSDARTLLSKACVVGYGNVTASMSDGLKKAGRCIAAGADEMYSFDASLKLINGCAKDNNQFNYYKAALYRDQNDAAEEAKAEQTRSQQRSVQQQEYTVLDMETGKLKICKKVGSMAHCF